MSSRYSQVAAPYFRYPAWRFQNGDYTNSQFPPITGAVGTNILTFTGLASASVFGTPTLNLSINPFTGLASASLFGTPALDLSINTFTGLVSASVFGVPTLSENITFTGLVSVSAFGTPVVDLAIKTFTGLASISAFGVPTITFSGVGVAQTIAFIGLATSGKFGLFSASAVGSPLNSDLDPAIPYTVQQQLGPEVVRWLRREMEKIKAKDEAIIYVTGNPEGVIAARPGTIALNNLGGAATTIYIKESGLGATGWVAK